MITIKFIWMLWTGVITPAGDNEGTKMYTVWFKDGKVIDYAYKNEVYNYIETGEFIYNEDLEYGNQLDEQKFYTNN